MGGSKGIYHGYCIRVGLIWYGYSTVLLPFSLLLNGSFFVKLPKAENQEISQFAHERNIETEEMLVWKKELVW